MTASQNAPLYDLLLKGGRVVDPGRNLDAVMDGALDDVIGPLQQEWQAEQLASLD